MDTQQAPEPTLATCYLQESGNEQHKIWLNKEYLQLIYKGRHKVFELKEIPGIEFNHRKLMLPLVLGGITATLSLVAIFRSYYNPWLMLSLLVAGLLAAYLGYLGSQVLTIHENKYHHDFFLKTISPNLRAFVAYANAFTGKQAQGILYLPMSMEEWQKAETQGHFRLQQDHRLFFKQEISNIPLHLPVIIPLNSLDETFPLHWAPDEQGALYPYISKGTTIPIQEKRPYFRQ